MKLEQGFEVLDRIQEFIQFSFAFKGQLSPLSLAGLFLVGVLGVILYKRLVKK